MGVADLIRRIHWEERGTLWTPPTMAGTSVVQTNDATPAAPGTTVTASGTTHTKGSFAQLIASTSFDTYLVEIHISSSFTSATNTASLLDIAIGGAGSETVIIPNLIAGQGDVMTASGTDPNAGGIHYKFPLYIPSGSRVSARMQSATASKTAKVSIRLSGVVEGVSQWVGQRVTDYGTNLATSQGVTVAWGVSAAEGSWTQITASSTNPCRYIALGMGLAGTTAIAAAYVALCDIGVGSATEQAVVQDAGHIISGTAEARAQEAIGGYCDIPSGSRLVARGSKGTTGAENFDCILYGVD